MMRCKYCNGEATARLTDGTYICDDCKADKLPQHGDVLAPYPIINHFSGHIKKVGSKYKQEPVLQHELSLEDDNKLSPNRRGLRLSLLYDTNYPLNSLPAKLRRKLEIITGMPSMTNYGNLEAVKTKS